MNYSLLLDLCESRLIPSQTSLQKWDIHILNELAYLYFLGLRILLSDDQTKQWARNYCARVARSGFDKWRTDGNDFYVLLYAASSEKHNSKSSISTHAIRDWLQHASSPSFDAHTQRLFNRLDAMFRISNSTLKTSRRLIMHWSETDARERQDLIGKLIAQIKGLAPRSELLDHLKHISKQYDDDDVNESASTGATGVASVATAIGGLGSGFNPNGDRGIYSNKAPVIVKREPKKKQSAMVKS